jgi:hypothetical protein
VKLRFPQERELGWIRVRGREKREQRQKNKVKGWGTEEFRKVPKKYLF